jgi:hypothetical protein
MTDLADLANDQDDVGAQTQSAAQAKFGQIYPLDHNVLSEVAGAHVSQSLFSHGFDIPGTKNAHLSVPVPRVSIALDAPVGKKNGKIYGAFLHTFLFADT